MASWHTSCFSATRCPKNKRYQHRNTKNMQQIIKQLILTLTGDNSPGHSVSYSANNDEEFKEGVGLALYDLLSQSVLASLSIVSKELRNGSDSVHR